MKKTLILICAAGLALACGKPQDAARREAPNISLAKLLQAPMPELKSLKELRGKAVVIEFWDISCHPCVDSIPHLNELVEAFEGKDVRFLAITNNTEAEVWEFLEEHPMKGWIGLDRGRQAFDAFQVSGIPKTVLLDKKGRIASVAYPLFIKAENIEALLEGEDPGVGKDELEDDTPPPLKGETEDPALLKVRVAKSAGKKWRSSVGEDSYEAEGVPLRYIVAKIRDFHESRVVLGKDVTDERYDAVVEIPGGNQAAVRDMLKWALESSLGLEIRVEERMTGVYVLKAPGALGPGLKKRTDGKRGSRSSYGTGGIDMEDREIGALVRALAITAEKPVLDETGLDGKYDIKVEWTKGDKDAMIQAVKSRLGLRLEPAERRIEMLVVSKRGQENGG